MKTSSTSATSAVTSVDGTTIGFRWFGNGPSLVLVRGSMMASQNFTKLAQAPSDDFTVYVPDRRGRGMSGPFGEDYSVRKEVEDLHALLRSTDSHFVFGLSSGAVMALEAARQLPEVRKLALYEPPLSFHDSSSVDWVPRYEQEMSEGKVAAAFATLVKGTKDAAVMELTPRFLLVPLLGLAIKADAKKVKDGYVAVADLVPTAHYDASVVIELADSLESFRGLQVEVLLLRGAKSARYLHIAFNRLTTVLGKVRCAELPGVGHLAADNGGKPQLVATELRRSSAMPASPKSKRATAIGTGPPDVHGARPRASRMGT